MLTPPDVLWVGFTNPQYRPDGHPSTQLRPHRGADQWPQRSESMRRWSVALSCQTSALAAPGTVESGVAGVWPDRIASVPLPRDPDSSVHTCRNVRHNVRCLGRWYP